MLPLPPLGEEHSQAAIALVRGYLRTLEQGVPGFVRCLELLLQGAVMRADHARQQLATDREAAAWARVSQRNWRRWCARDPGMFRAAGVMVQVGDSLRRRWSVPRLDAYLAAHPQGRKKPKLPRRSERSE